MGRGLETHAQEGMRGLPGSLAGPKQHAQRSAALGRKLQAANRARTYLPHPGHRNLTCAGAERLLESPQHLTAHDQHPIQNNAVRGERRRKRLERWRCPHAPTCEGKLSQLGKRREQQCQLTDPEMAEDLDQAASRPSTTRKARIESIETTGQDLAVRCTDATPDGRMLEQSSKLDRPSGAISGHGLQPAGAGRDLYPRRPWEFSL